MLMLTLHSRLFFKLKFTFHLHLYAKFVPQVDWGKKVNREKS